MKLIYLSIGSNIQPEKNVPAAIELLKKAFPVTKISSIYETDPVGPTGKDKFWNLVLAIRSGDPAEILIKKLRGIEEELGRARSENKYAPRTIDIDVLPQAGYQQQAFIMVPLAEIAPEEKDAESGKSFGELAKKLDLKGQGRVLRIRSAASGDLHGTLDGPRHGLHGPADRAGH